MQKDAEQSYRKDIIRFPWKNKARTIVLTYHKSNKNTPKHGGIQNYCVLCNKSVIPECKYILHSADACFLIRPVQDSLKEYIGGGLGNRVKYVKMLQKFDKKWKKDMKAPKK